MRGIFRISVVLWVLFFLGCYNKTGAEGRVGAYEFSLKDLSNQMVNLSDFRDKQEVMLFFWATWCSFCRSEIKELIQRYPKLKKDNIEVLAIDIDETKKRVERFIGSSRIEFKILLDEGAEVATIYNIQGVPTYIWVDKQGNIKYRGNRLPKELLTNE